MLTEGRMIAGMAIIAATILAVPAYACDDDRFPCPPKGLQRHPLSYFLGQDTVARPVQKRAKPRTRAPANVAAPKRKPAADAPPPAVAAPAPAAAEPPAPVATRSVQPAPANVVTPPPKPEAETPLTAKPVATVPAPPVPTGLTRPPAAAPSPSAAVAPLAPVMLTPPAELARIIKQSELPDPTAGVVWIVSPNEVNHIDMQAGGVVVVTTRGDKDKDFWSEAWFQRLMATIGGALAAASAFRMFFA